MERLSALKHVNARSDFIFGTNWKIRGLCYFHVLENCLCILQMYEDDIPITNPVWHLWHPRYCLTLLPFFSVVSGPFKDPTTVPGSYTYNHLGPWNFITFATALDFISVQNVYSFSIEFGVCICYFWSKWITRAGLTNAGSNMVNMTKLRKPMIVKK